MIGAIVRALTRRQAAVILVVLEVGFGFAVSVEAFVLARWFERTFALPSGIDDDTFVVTVADAGDGPAAVELAALRVVPGVAAAGPIGRVPMLRTLFPDLATATDGRAAIAWELDGVATRAILNVPLRTGRDLVPADANAPGVTPVLIDDAFATRLFPDGMAVGRTFSLRHRDRPLVVVGVIESFGAVSGFAIDHLQILILPDVAPVGRLRRYLVRAEAGRIERVRAAAAARLTGLGPNRAVMDRSLVELRARNDRNARGGVAIFSYMVVVVLLTVLLGTLAMSSFLVAERVKQIGTRRALGASRRAIVREFLIENWLVTTFGLLLGLPLAYGLNFVALRAQPDLVLDWPALVLGMVLFWIAGLAAALVPALRAALISPSVATRTL